MSKIQKPKSEDALCDLVQNTIANKQTLGIIGGGTRPIGNRFKADLTVSSSAIKGVSIFEPGALTLVAKAGTSLDEIQKLLATENQHLPFEPADYRGLLGTKGKSTIGGVVAAGISGPRRIQVGAARDALIGVRFVNGEGTAIKNGGRVMKNVTGYDLVKLMAGSYGTLGILTEVAFKVLPMVEKSNTIMVHGLSDTDATIVMSKALGSPYDIAGAAHVPDKRNAVTYIRVEGFKKSVAYRTAQLKELIAKQVNKSVAIDVESNSIKSANIWKSIRDVEPFHKLKGTVWKISVKPTQGAKVVAEFSKSMQVKSLYDWGGGLVWLLVEDDTNQNADLSADVIRATVKNAGGHATLMRASDETYNAVEAFHPQAPRLAMISNQLRAQFDPHGIFNPQLMEKTSTRQMLEAG